MEMMAKTLRAAPPADSSTSGVFGSSGIEAPMVKRATTARRARISKIIAITLNTIPKAAATWDMLFHRK